MSWTLFFFIFFNKGHYNYNIYLSVSKLNMFVGFQTTGRKFIFCAYVIARINTMDLV